MRHVTRRQQHTVVQRQHDKGQSRGKIECGRGQERDTQHAHGASAKFVRRRGKRIRLGIRLAVQDDRGDATHAVEEARLEPRQRKELAARGGRCTNPCRGHGDRNQQTAQNQYQRAHRIAQQRWRSPPAAGRRSPRTAAGSQREYSPSNASMRSTMIAVNSPLW